jgi:hypothetical protein
MSTDKNDHLPRPDWCFALFNYYRPVVARFYLVVFLLASPYLIVSGASCHEY